jgi:hypothetical protein
MQINILFIAFQRCRYSEWVIVNHSITAAALDKGSNYKMMTDGCRSINKWPTKKCILSKSDVNSLCKVLDDDKLFLSVYNDTRECMDVSTDLCVLLGGQHF